MLYQFAIIIILLGIIVYQYRSTIKQERDYQLLIKSRTLEEFQEVAQKRPKVTNTNSEPNTLVPIDEAIDDMSPKEVKEAFKSDIKDNE